MVKVIYTIRDDKGSLRVGFPRHVALPLGIVDIDGVIIIPRIRYELGVDDIGPYGIIRPA